MPILPDKNDKSFRELYDWVKRHTGVTAPIRGFDIHCHLDDIVTIDLVILAEGQEYDMKVVASDAKTEGDLT